VAAIAPDVAPLPEHDTFAFAELDARVLAGALFFLRAANQAAPGPIHLAVRDGLVELTLADGTHLVRLAAQDSGGSCVTTITPEPFELIWEHARALSRSCRDYPVQLFVSPGDVVLCAPGSDPEASGGAFTLSDAAAALAAIP
jgi:hypothetical protein